MGSWVGKICWRKKKVTHSSFLPGESNGQRSLAGYSSWSQKSQTRLRDYTTATIVFTGLPWWLSSKEFSCSVGAAGDVGSIPGSGGSPGGRHSNSLQYSCLENPMNRGAWQAIVHKVTKSQAQLKRLSTAWHSIHNGKISTSK